ncbi:MAG: type II toxin-antitoxin system VapC family toxin [Rhodanobacteraceae bacterium]|jgi:tRNA(fMet)-specific endonuclease VapC|nr:type II toxin-antitoxin system VapC family toxin [Rhodanobacteraceae bacterium]
MPDLRYLLDTNIVSAVVKAPDGPLARRLAELPREAFGISLVVAAELRYGVLRKGSTTLARQLEAVLGGIDIVPLEEPVDHHYGEIRNALARIGQPIGQNDLFIAAHARALGVVLVTANVREFARVPGLKVENWLAAADDSEV